MSETIFTTQNITKRYKQFHALNNLNMAIKQGDIYGFVGENGSGKTTLIRILSGLATQTSGEFSLFGVSDAKQLPKQRTRIAGIIESPAFYPELSAVENLEVVRLQRGIPGKDCISQALQAVHLMDTEKKKAKHFSLGMKQRLGLAMALMGNPEFLILDEPVNGLDPTGIVEFRKLLKTLNRERGITILISSHMLGELYQLATRYGFIHKGKMMQQISVNELDEKCKKHLHIQVDDVSKASVVLETMLHTNNFNVLPNNTLRLYDYLDKSGEVSNALFSQGVTITELTTKGDSLEEYYISLIGGQK